MPDCTAHRVHVPRNLTIELHHVIPQAWQHFWAPKTTQDLWDPRTVALCPTGHRNVHVLIVRMMRAVKTAPVQVLPPEDARRLAKVRRGVEGDTALLALQRWVDAGGSLRGLVDHGLLGEA